MILCYGHLESSHVAVKLQRNHCVLGFSWEGLPDTFWFCWWVGTCNQNSVWRSSSVTEWLGTQELSEALVCWTVLAGYWLVVKIMTERAYTDPENDGNGIVTRTEWDSAIYL